MTLTKIIEILNEFKDFDPSTINRETTFEALGLDSLDVVDFVMKLEETFEVTIPMDKDLLKTVGNVIDLIESNQKEGESNQ